MIRGRPRDPWVPWLGVGLDPRGPAGTFGDTGRAGGGTIRDRDVATPTPGGDGASVPSGASTPHPDPCVPQDGPHGPRRHRTGPCF